MRRRVEVGDEAEFAGGQTGEMERQRVARDLGFQMFGDGIQPSRIDVFGAHFQRLIPLGVEVFDLGITFRQPAFDGLNRLQSGPLAASTRNVFAGDQDSLAQAMLFDQRSRDERIAFLRNVASFGISQESITLGVQFQNALYGCENFGTARF